MAGLARDEIILLPPSPAFLAMTRIVERVTGRQVDAAMLVSELDSYYAAQSHLHIPNNDVEGLLHEMCHWTAAGPSRRGLQNYGLDKGDPGWRTSEQEEIICGWIEEYLYRSAGVPMPESSVKEVQYHEYPWWQPVALSRWRRYVGWETREKVIQALQLPGGQIGLWSPWH